MRNTQNAWDEALAKEQQRADLTQQYFDGELSYEEYRRQLAKNSVGLLEAFLVGGFIGLILGLLLVRK